MPAATVQDPATPEEAPPEEVPAETGGEETEGPGEENPQEGDYLLWAGQLPAARGPVAQAFAKIPSATQRLDAEKLHAFLTNQAADLAKLNSEPKLLAALVNVPESALVKVVYGLGFGTSGISTTNPSDGKLLMLTGELEESHLMRRVDSLMLPADLCTAKEMACPSDATFCNTLRAAASVTNWPLIRLRGAQEEVAEVSKIAPLPAFLVYDGFDSELHAGEVFERLSSLDAQDSTMVKHAKDFCKSCLIQRRATDERCYGPYQAFMTSLPTCARKWANERARAIVPSATTRPNPPATLPSPRNTLEEILRSLAMKANTPGPNHDPEEGYTDASLDLGMCNTEMKKTLQMCGLEPGEESLLPAWMRLVAEKGTNDNTKNQIIIAALKKGIYDDAEITVHASLLQMIRKRKWMSDDPTPSLRTATKGLSPFGILVSDEDVAAMNETMEALENATTTTASEYKLVTKILPHVPTDAWEFLLLLKTFANLLYALFGSGCPLYQHVRMIIKALFSLKRNALKTMPAHTKASILWITLLQTRHFAAGEITLLAEFKNMLEKIVSKDMTISHAEVPAALVAQTPSTPTKTKRDRDLNPIMPEPDEDRKRKKPPDSDTIHPLLKRHFVDNVLRTAPRASLTQICTFCNTSVRHLCRDNKRCVLAMLGMCKNKRCTRDHSPATDAEAKNIETLLDKAIKNPGDIVQQG